MERNNEKRKNFYFSFKKIKKIYLPIILTIFIIFNLSFIPNSVGTNENINFQPSSASGESYYFSSTYFKSTNKKNGQNNDVGTAIWILTIIFCIIFGIVYFIINKLKNNNEHREETKNDYIELLKDDSDYEGNI